MEGTNCQFRAFSSVTKLRYIILITLRYTFLIMAVRYGSIYFSTHGKFTI